MAPVRPALRSGVPWRDGRPPSASLSLTSSTKPSPHTPRPHQPFLPAACATALGSPIVNDGPSANAQGRPGKTPVRPDRDAR